MDMDRYSEMDMDNYEYIVVLRRPIDRYYSRKCTLILERHAQYLHVIELCSLCTLKPN